jgi:hypothetical protein
MTDMAHPLIALLVEEVATGKPSRRRGAAAMISVTGFELLTDRGLWREALLAVGKIKTPDPRAQQRFVKLWMIKWGSEDRGWSAVRGLVGDDDIYFKALRVLLPAYKGPPITLYRGQLKHEPIEPSWTSDEYIARRYAHFGFLEPNPKDLEEDPATRDYFIGFRDDEEPVLLEGEMHREIISELFNYSAEFVVDPRKAVFSIERLLPWDEEQEARLYPRTWLIKEEEKDEHG